jgi:hypothetical protein
VTIFEYWKQKGIDMNTLENIIDLFPEDSDASNSAKDLMQILTDESFEGES